jgi:GT2 family glycosyltransferase
MNIEQPLVSIITVNHNQSSVTCELLQSLYNMDYKSIEIIVVDNASQSEDPSVIEHQFPKVKLIRSPRFLGFAASNNLGISLARGVYILLLENDVEVKSNFLGPLVNFFKENPETGMLCPKIKNYNRPEIIEYAGYTTMHRFLVSNKLIGYGEKDLGQYDTIVETDFGHRVALMVFTEVVKKVGLLPDIYYLYYDEMDWAERIKEAGFRIFYYPNAVVYYKKIDLPGLSFPVMEYYKHRNQILFTRRNYKGINKSIALFYLYSLEMPKLFLKHLITAKFASAVAIIRGLWWNILTFKIHTRCDL